MILKVYTTRFEDGLLRFGLLNIENSLNIDETGNIVNHFLFPFMSRREALFALSKKHKSYKRGNHVFKIIVGKECCD